MIIEQDPNGITGSLLHYSLVLFFVLGALVILLYLWKNGRLDMDEEPKYEMMRESESMEELEDKHVRK
jgi:hypothetical protein